MRITEVEFKKSDNKEQPNLLAFVTMVFDDAYAVHDARIIRRDDGTLIVSMPHTNSKGEKCSRCTKRSEKRWHFCPHCGNKLNNVVLPNEKLLHDIFHPITPQARAEMVRIVLKEYHEAFGQVKQTV